ncbi:hypothetical protein KS4_36900 [Poriferisphaera corsica]|uniref:Uncharacterized protein n=1 Tax=Poriferisphaera corsica TaxID=2528020 RepID=A0A517YZF4_9BACT|nr:hypothetical protein KS4_36900 [Poriferisphaera corsica]
MRMDCSGAAGFGAQNPEINDFPVGRLGRFWFKTDSFG